MILLFKTLQPTSMMLYHSSTILIKFCMVWYTLNHISPKDNTVKLESCLVCKKKIFAAITSTGELYNYIVHLLVSTVWQCMLCKHCKFKPKFINLTSTDVATITEMRYWLDSFLWCHKSEVCAVRTKKSSSSNLKCCLKSISDILFQGKLELLIQYLS